ncbi:SPOR domain-containing protein [Alteromonas facilis]|uniref:SPOR domain-containing protein n=1 Tax=Alteromonas facilis TaxID=2048004 RepID=UPI000C28BC5E|nr:SPOR domain-containing protein [Alteromonas facilis]
MLRKASLHIFSIMALTSLSGCNSTSSPSEQVEFTQEQRYALIAMLEKRDENEQLIKSWKEARPAVMRLVSIDSELKLLIEQLDVLASQSASQDSDATVDKSPAVIAGAADRPEDSNIEPITPNTVVKVADNNLTGKYAIQLMALDTKQKIEGAWQQLTASHASELSGFTPVAEEIETASGTIYRLKIGQFDTKIDALFACEALMEKGIRCFTSQYGNALHFL